MHSLWTVYVAATFAAAGFGSSGDFSRGVAAAVTVGFWLFAIGHLVLLVQTLGLLTAAKKDLKTVSATDHSCSKTAAKVQTIYNPSWVAVPIHLAIDVCVTIAIWVPVLAPKV